MVVFVPGRRWILWIISMVLLICIPQRINADNKDLRYPVAEIPDELKSNAIAVIRNEEKTLTLSGSQYAKMETSLAITILNENALQYSTFEEYYGKFDRISMITCRVYDANGHKVEQMQYDEILDHSAISFSSLYDDTRVKYFKPRYRTYPFTVEFRYTTEYFGFLGFPEWFPGRAHLISVQYSAYKVIADNSFPIRYFNKNTGLLPEVVKNKNTTVYTWTMENQPALVEQPWCQSIMDYLPGIVLSPQEFSLDGYKGNYGNWYSFGQWIKEINKERDQLRNETIVLLNDLVKNCTSDYEKARILYEYMQKKTRYVSIQIGIGGWQPFKAEDVDRLGYGDCKALANYYKALLNAVGIKSHYALVRAGENAPSIIREFPSQQFNHAIVCLPLKGDTCWIECTSPHLPFTYIGTFTDDRDVLLIGDEGGKIVHTRSYSASENRRTARITIRLDEQGNAGMIMKRKFEGSFFNEKLHTYLSDFEDQKKLLYEELNLPGSSIDSFNLVKGTSHVPWIEESMGVEVPHYGSRTGSRLVVQLNRLPALQTVPKKVALRKADVIIKRSFSAIDTIEYILPENYEVESLPVPRNQVSIFGRCEYSCMHTGNKVIYVRRYIINKGSYSPSEYEGLISFIKNTILQDMAKMSLLKKEV